MLVQGRRRWTIASSSLIRSGRAAQSVISHTDIRGALVSAHSEFQQIYFALKKFSLDDCDYEADELPLSHRSTNSERHINRKMGVTLTAITAISVVVVMLIQASTVNGKFFRILLFQLF